MGNFGKALSDFNKALSINPNYSQAYYNRAIYYDGLNNSKLAVINLDSAIKYNDKNFLAYEMRGKIKQKYKLHLEAIQDFDYSISQKPNNITALYYRSLSYHELGRLHSALDDLNQVLNYDPTLVPALFIRADVLKSLNKIEEAIIDYENILSEQRNNTRAKKELIKIKRAKRP